MGGIRIRYPDPAIKVNDTVKIDLSSGKISEYITFDTGVIAMVIGGRNMGRVGVVTHRERHDGGFNIVHIKDAIDNSFATRESNVFVIGSEKPWISLPKGKGVQVSNTYILPNTTTMLISYHSLQLRKREIVVGPTPLQGNKDKYESSLESSPKHVCSADNKHMLACLLCSRAFKQHQV